MNKFATCCGVVAVALSLSSFQAGAGYYYDDDGSSCDTDDISFNSSTSWSDWGQNINNSHFNINSGISKFNIDKVVQLCAIDYRMPPAMANGTVYSKPLIVKDVVYWTAIAGSFGSPDAVGVMGAHKLKRDYLGRFVGCEKLWQKRVIDVVDVGVPSLYVRSSPAYYERSNGKGTLLYLTPAGIFDFAFNPASDPQAIFSYKPTAYAIDAATGNKLWQVPISLSGAEDPSSIFMNTTGSPRVYNGYAYFGLSSYNNLKAFIGFPGQEQTSRGHLIRLNLKINGGTPSFANDVKTLYSIPAKPAGYQGKWFAGGGIWASTPSIIPYGGKNNKGLVIYSSGQLYENPDFVDECMSEPVTPVTFEGKTFSKRGETGGGAQQCYDRAVIKLKELGVDVKNEPLANNSAIAVNLADFTHAWHVPTNGIDAWQYPCGLDSENPPMPEDCSVAVPGPDWDIGGNSPVVVRYLLQTMVITHNKGGELLWISPYDGSVTKRVDACVGNVVGGIHWGFAYDPIRKTLIVPCAGADATTGTNYNTTAANGNTYCYTGILNGINAITGQLKWQAIPARAVLSGGPECPTGGDVIDQRYKHGKTFNVVIKNQVNASVPVNVMPDSPSIPVIASTGRGDGVPATSRGIAYWALANGAVYAIDVNNGSYLSQFFCDKGGVYTATPSVAGGYIAFGCGRQAVTVDDGGIYLGKSIMIYGKQRDF